MHYGERRGPVLMELGGTCCSGTQGLWQRTVEERKGPEELTFQERNSRQKAVLTGQYATVTTKGRAPRRGTLPAIKAQGTLPGIGET